LNEHFTNFTFSRLGKTNSTITDRSRPIKIRFTEQSDVFTILRTQRKLKSSIKWSNIRFSSDKTIKQRDEMANLRKILQNRRDKDEQNLIIKYVKGTPQIINTTKN
jgi:hypothetical protein